MYIEVAQEKARGNMNSFPEYREENGCITIDFCFPSKNTTNRPIDAVIDFDKFSQPIGIEIISICYKLGDRCLDLIMQLNTATGSDFRYSYDEGCDCFAFDWADNSSLDQKVIEIDCALDAAGHITSFCIPLSSIGCG